MKPQFVTLTRWLGLILTAAGGGSMLAIQFAETTIDEDGMLHEPFYLLPIGLLLMGMGIGLWLTGWLARSKVSCQDPTISREAE